MLIDFATPAMAITQALADRLENRSTGDDALFERDLEVAANDLAQQIHASASGFALRAEEERREHRDDVLHQWGPALDLYVAFISIAESCLIATFARREEEAREAGVDPDPRLRVLAGMQARMCRVALAVQDLLLGGLPAAALASSRTAHELAVYSTVIGSHGAPDGEHPTLAARFDAYGQIERLKDARAHLEIDPTAFSEEDMARFAAERDTAVAEHGPDLKGKYGWATVLFDRTHIEFPHLERLATLQRMRSHYRWANHEVHATSRSLLMNAAITPDRIRYRTGRSTAGLAEPASATLTSVLHGLVAGA
ncbi:DUF5677 domain-containing protein [Cellulomonas phragmiteti]|uniref:DUF5677 domain-containing protein n=1 Tax=Cellulomonas phragmiteti TaxID=478780 RepID=UPI0035EB85D6